VTTTTAETRLREALDAGPTPGPYHWWDGLDVDPETGDQVQNGPEGIYSQEGGCTVLVYEWVNPPNIRLAIACDPDTIRSLLAELDRLRARDAVMTRLYGAAKSFDVSLEVGGGIGWTASKVGAMRDRERAIFHAALDAVTALVGPLDHDDMRHMRRDESLDRD